MRTKIRMTAVVAAAAVLTSMVGLAQAQEKKANPVVVMKTTKGTLKIELLADKAPETVKNFLAYVDEKFYDGTIIHRAMDGRLLQGGQYDKEWKRKQGRAPIKNEATAENKNVRGTISMTTRGEDPNSAVCQFLINLRDNASADHKDETGKGFGRCVFGKIIEGMDAAEKMGGVETTTTQGHDMVPKEPIVIESITRAEAK
jgi:peptidyl-prolyl cis-trans isomerase B (cyclophilin B)